MKIKKTKPNHLLGEVVLDISDPVGACAYAKKALKPDDSSVVVESGFHHSLYNNLNPVARAFYAFSTQLCALYSQIQEVGLSLCAQAGLKRPSETIKTGGFSHRKIYTGTPCYIILKLKL